MIENVEAKYREAAEQFTGCASWKWMSGMLVRNGEASIRLVNPAPALPLETGWLPDLSDPATFGCLLSLVREAYNAPEACTGKIGPFWYVYPMADNGIAATTPPLGMTWNDRHTTELAALVAALEAA